MHFRCKSFNAKNLRRCMFLTRKAIQDVNSPSSGGSTLTVWGKFFGLVDYGDDLQVPYKVFWL
jgi:hypothetical protein